VDERGERSEVGAAHGFRGLERGTAGEDGEPREERLLVRLFGYEATYVPAGAEAALEPSA
jgi:hypothetical protein